MFYYLLFLFLPLFVGVNTHIYATCLSAEQIQIKTRLAKPMLEDAATGKLADKLHWYLEQGLYIDELDHGTGETALMIASQNGHLELVQQLLAHHADPTMKRNDGKTITQILSKIGRYPNIVKLLRDEEKKIQKRRSAFKVCSELEFQMILTAFHRSLTAKELAEYMKKGASINAQDKWGNSLLMGAIRRGSLEFVELLLRNKANVNLKDEKGNSALHQAIDFKKSDAVRLLLEKNADVNTTDNEGFTPMFSAVDHGDLDLIKKLQQKGANIHAISYEGKTTLMEAAQSGCHDVAAYLIDQGATINAISKENYTPLMMASVGGYADIVELLLTKGANPLMHSIYGETALSMAQEKFGSNKRLIKLLKDAMAKKIAEQKIVATREAEEASMQRKELLVQHNAQAQNIVASIDSALREDDLKTVQTLLDDLKLKTITDVELLKRITSMQEQYHKIVSDGLMARFEQAMEAFKLKPTDARLQEAQAIIGLLEEQKNPAIKEFILAAKQKVKAIEQERQGTPEAENRMSPAHETGRSTPGSIVPPHMVIDPYQTIAAAPEAYQSRIKAVIEQLSENYTKTDAQELAGFAGLWKKRIGDYRIIYKILPAQQAIGIVNIASRSEVYENENLLRSREKNFIRLNDAQAQELAQEAEELLKTHRADDAHRSAALLKLYCWLNKETPHHKVKALLCPEQMPMSSALVQAQEQKEFNDRADQALQRLHSCRQ